MHVLSGEVYAHITHLHPCTRTYRAVVQPHKHVSQMKMPSIMFKTILHVIYMFISPPLNFRLLRMRAGVSVSAAHCGGSVDITKRKTSHRPCTYIHAGISIYRCYVNILLATMYVYDCLTVVLPRNHCQLLRL